MSQQMRRLVPPFGWPIKLRIATVAASENGPFVAWNRYPRQVIGVSVRLPDMALGGGRNLHPRLSILWAKPARWWR